MKRNKLLAVALSTAMVAGALTGCGGGSEEAKKDDSKGSVYYLNFKPEVAEVWEEVAKKYTEETGVDVKVVTAASGNYESTLKSEIAKTDAPTLFQINGPIGYQSWKDYCADLSDTDFYKSLSDQSLAIKGEDGGWARASSRSPGLSRSSPRRRPQAPRTSPSRSRR